LTAGFAFWGAYGSQARTVAHVGGTATTPDSSDLQTFFMEVLIGFTLTACVLVAGPVSGGAANPARALGR